MDTSSTETNEVKRPQRFESKSKWTGGGLSSEIEALTLDELATTGSKLRTSENDGKPVLMEDGSRAKVPEEAQRFFTLATHYDKKAKAARDEAERLTSEKAKEVRDQLFAELNLEDLPNFGEHLKKIEKAKEEHHQLIIPFVLADAEYSNKSRALMAIAWEMTQDSVGRLHECGNDDEEDISVQKGWEIFSKAPETLSDILNALRDKIVIGISDFEPLRREKSDGGFREFLRETFGI